MTWLDRVFKLGDRVADLTERGVVALEKLAGTPLKDLSCKHVWIAADGEGSAVCDLCGETKP